MDRVHINQAIVGIASMQVCVTADATDEEILAECNSRNPSGTTNGWSLVRRDNPTRCEMHPDRIHYLVDC